jgi:hypothetical protein
MEDDNPDPPPDPWGRGDKNKIESVLKYSWDEKETQTYRIRQTIKEPANDSVLLLPVFVALAQT